MNDEARVWLVKEKVEGENPTPFGIPAISKEISEMVGILGDHYIFRFRNGYGASVIELKSNSYARWQGRWEVAVYWHGEMIVDSPITQDVIRCSNNTQVTEILIRIASFPPKETLRPKPESKGEDMVSRTDVLLEEMKRDRK